MRWFETRFVRMSVRAFEREISRRTGELRRENERLLLLACTDALTGLANRRLLRERLDAAISFARRTGTPVAVALVDLDRLKEVNDTFGHEAGDRLLVMAAQAMRSELRTEDLLGRWGGDEFVALLPGTDEEGAWSAAERMRRAVERLAFALHVGSGTISTGVAVSAAGAADADELLRRADVALYSAKSRGRGRTASWVALRACEELPEVPESVPERVTAR